jgi:hypothetical protein
MLQAHEQNGAMLLTLLNELPSNLPVLLLGTSSLAFTDLEEKFASIYCSLNVQVPCQMFFSTFPRLCWLAPNIK